MKIAALICTYPPYKGGMGNAAKQFAELTASSHQITVFTPRYQAVKVNPTNPGVAVEYLFAPLRFGNAAWLPQLFWRLRQFDVIYLHYPFYGVNLVALLSAVIFGKPLITHYHMDTVETGFRAVPFWLCRRLVLPLVLAYSRRIIVSSLDYAKESNLKSYLEQHPAKFTEIPFWVDTERFIPVPERGRAEAVALLFVGALDSAHYFKGLQLLFQALNLLARTKSGLFNLTIVGDGNLRNQYEAQAKELGLFNMVRFAGKLDDAALAATYQSSDLLILPSINKSEAFGLVLLEAMSSGLPVITSDLPGVRSVYLEGESGLSFRAGDVAALSEKLDTLISDQPRRLAMGRQARQRVLEKFTVHEVQKLLNQTYEDCRN